MTKSIEPIWASRIPEAVKDAAVLLAAFEELQERADAGDLNSEVRYDLGVDLNELTDRLKGFALAVMG